MRSVPQNRVTVNNESCLEVPVLTVNPLLILNHCHHGNKRSTEGNVGWRKWRKMKKERNKGVSQSHNTRTKQNCVALVRERTIPTERPQLVNEVSANICGQRVSRGQRNRSPRKYSRLSRPEPLLFLPNSFSIVLTRLRGPRSRPITSQKIW
jgi:hypothetical protein